MADPLEIDIEVPLRRFPLRVRATARGRCLAVLGPSGAGKTSLLEALCGLRQSVKGSIRIQGRTVLDSAARVRLPPEQRRIGYVPQESLLFPHLTAEQNIRFALGDGPDAVHRFDSAVDLAEVRPLLPQRPATLSGGERQRVALARALASAPQLLVLDEPLAALDMELRQRILPYLLRVRDEAGVHLVYVTHHRGEARALADEVLLLDAGQVSAFGAASEILSPDKLLALDARAGPENVVRGTLSGPRLTLPSGHVLHVPAAEGETGAGVYAVPADDVLVSVHPLTGTSARNILVGPVRAISEAGDDALLEVETAGMPWFARLTRLALGELELAIGKTVHLALKTHSFRRMK